MRVLVVDDVGYARHYHARVLQKFGYDVQTAESGSQALKLLSRDHSIDAVLTDLLMRDMDGVELFKNSQKIDRMTDNGQADPPKFILMTALRPGSNQQQRDVEKLSIAKDIGFVAVLFKPIEPDLLKKTFEAIQFSSGEKRVDVVGVISQLESAVRRIVEAKDKEAATRLTEVVENSLSKLQDFMVEA
jgi:CheY-like chemotaxis protein